ncbi:uncharacterized protein LOC134282625 [Saccostrea cucullata]|uniref:uncharacterized protein LOC134282625 n=1 Tax=Saccostrea cuccullata TaxID=36930 RepID=UPI002ED067CE
METLSDKMKKWKLQLLLSTILALVSVARGMIHNMAIPQGLDDCFTRYAQKTSIRHTVGQSINWICVHQYMWQQNGMHKWLNYNVTSNTNMWYSRLLVFPNRRTLTNSRAAKIRTEIRMLSDMERQKFLKAIQMLKEDKSIYPNKYDALAALHQGITETAAHGGPNFLGWHRVFLIMFENAMREKIPDVTLPYWDSTLDEPMANPVASVIWSSRFLGNGNGLVNTGPFADWSTPVGPLIRNLANTGQLFNRRVIQNILTRKRIGEITEPHAYTPFNLEFHHGEVHMWVDGQMGELTTAAMDPVFFLHHAYIDYIWEKFRAQQRRNGIDPTRDYPSVVNHTLHLPTSMLGLGTFRNIDSFSEYIVNGIYRYEDSPSCSAFNRNCGSSYLQCINQQNEWICVSVDQAHMPPLQHHAMFANNMQMQQQQQQRVFQQRLVELSRLRVPNMNINIHRVGPNTMPNAHPAVISHLGRNVLMSVRRDRAKPMGFEVFQMPSQPQHTTFQHMNTNIPRIRGTGTDINRMIHGMSQNRIQNSMLPPSPSPVTSSQETCPVIPVNRPYQNTFNINGISDMRQWVYLPVDVVYKRPPDYERYNAFPVIGGRPLTRTDIYEPEAYATLRTPLNTGRPASYASCNTGQFGAGAVFIQSNGINYVGTYKEYAIVDHRLAISSSTAFVAIKNPGYGATDVMLSAYDSCGRICRPYCKIPTSQTGESQPCSGMLRVTSSYPKLYANDYGEAVYKTWSLGNSCPTKDSRQVYMTFYCDYEEDWPMPGVVPVNMPTPPPIPILLIPRAMNTQQPSADATCDIGEGCIVPGECGFCFVGTVQKCQNSCDQYAVCIYGQYVADKCKAGTMYDVTTHRCVPGSCSEEIEPTAAGAD